MQCKLDFGKMISYVNALPGDSEINEDDAREVSTNPTTEPVIRGKPPPSFTNGLIKKTGEYPHTTPVTTNQRARVSVFKATPKTMRISSNPTILADTTNTTRDIDLQRLLPEMERRDKEAGRILNSRISFLEERDDVRTHNMLRLNPRYVRKRGNWMADDPPRNQPPVRRPKYRPKPPAKPSHVKPKPKDVMTQQMTKPVRVRNQSATRPESTPPAGTMA
ncbi:hypothetical protein PV326_001271, partial [Microctonus aethiopoides]